MYQSPENVEKQDLIWGVPKLVWVILLDVLCMVIFMACIPTVMYVAKQKRPELDGAEACCPCCCPEKPAKFQRAMPVA